MPKNRNQLMRIHTIDACLQRRNRLWTIDDLVEACEEALYEYEGIPEISSRTIRRDLQLMRSEKLGYCAPIIVKDRKYYTYEDPDFSITKLPLSREDLNELSSALDIIKHYSTFNALSGQDDIITRMQDKVYSQENRSKVVFLETNDRLQGLSFLGVLYAYIIKKVPLAIRYRSFYAKNETVQHMSPYILKEFNNRWFVMGYSKFTKSVRILALDRILEIKKDKENPYIDNSIIDPQTYFEDIVGVTRNFSDQPQEVVLKADCETAPYIETKPLHSSQQTKTHFEDGSIEVTLRVILNPELERLILGFGCHLEVKSPTFLRESVAKHFSEAKHIYGL